MKGFAMMEWDESLATGIPIVDEQHQALFHQVADLLDQSRVERARETLTFLENYVIVHFGTEEKLQRESKYSEADGHKKMHDAFMVALAELKAEYESSDDKMLILMKITKAALDWLEYHIKGADKDFGDYYKASAANAPKRSAHDTGLRRVIRVPSGRFKKIRE